MRNYLNPVSIGWQELEIYSSRPNSSDMESLDQLDASLLKMNDNINKDNVIIVGDFNAPDIDWQNPNVSSICKQHDLTQFVEEPTRR